MKSVLVHLDASPRSAVRLALAHRVAQQQGARLTAMYAVLPSLLAVPWASAEGMSSAASALFEFDRLQRDRARALFDREAGSGPMQWLEANFEGLRFAFLQAALFADLVVLGQGDSSDDQTGALPPDFVPSVITDSGRPTLVVPCVGPAEQIGSQVLLAWKPTREAARAASAALPWLRQAAAVHVARQPAAQEGGHADIAALESWLRLQGVTAPLRRHVLGSGEVGEALLSLAADTAADLLVMGCYGHSRARELVLGGASRTVLQSMTLPVLMAH
ncbi:MAG: universal stress protein [Rubrivivax sp.]|nr:universal stress protein [Rubrivivax sp.]